MGSRLRHVRAIGRGWAGAVSLAAVLLATASPAEARHHRPGESRPHASRHTAGAARGAGPHVTRRALISETPMFAAMVVDAGTGRTLFADHENDLRHPASITKVMTLYLLFEKLKSGAMRLDDRIPVSVHAASMSPTKLGLRPGSTIAVEDAIKAIVTKSANDMAVAVAEAVGGDEHAFAALMTEKARALGMARTQYVNASGLPDARQLTTARDLTVLGRAIRANFPGYYHFFSTPSFTYAGQFMANHNHLLGRVDGMDGIKTGYTGASGFNLLTSVARDGHRIVSVVLGGRTAASRDRIMTALIEDHIGETSTTEVAETPTPREQPAETVADAREEAEAPHEVVAAPPPPEATADEEQRGGPSLIAPTLALPPVPAPRPVDRARTVARAEAPAAPVERPRPAYIPATPRLDRTASIPADRRRLVLDGSTATRVTEVAAAEDATATPSALHWKVGPPGLKLDAVPPPRPAESGRARGAQASPDAGGWTIQVGATDAPGKASDLLKRAQSQDRPLLASAKLITEKVRKGEATLYRARFAGLEPQQAEAACRTLKRSGFACFATRD